MGDAIKPSRFFSNISLLENDLGGFVEFTVPANELLRIEFVTGEVRLPAGQSPYIKVTIRILDTNGFDTGLFYVSSHKRGSFDGQDSFEFGQLVRLYADPGTKVIAAVNRVGPGPLGQGGADVSISGQLFTV